MCQFCQTKYKTSKCAVEGCNEATKGIRYHKFPISRKNGRHLLRLWVRACGNAELTIWNVRPSAKICQRHFLPADYSPRGRLRLKAVPTRNLPPSVDYYGELSGNPFSDRYFNYDTSNNLEDTLSPADLDVLFYIFQQFNSWET